MLLPLGAFGCSGNGLAGTAGFGAGADLIASGVFIAGRVGRPTGRFGSPVEGLTGEDGSPVAVGGLEAFTVASVASEGALVGSP